MSKLIVVKLGTKYLLGRFAKRDHQLDPFVFSDVARQIMQTRQEQETGVIIVSSGAVAAGWRSVWQREHSFPSAEERGFASIGTRHLLNHWGDAFALYGKDIAQIWVTRANLQNDEELRGIRATITLALEAEAIPILNENDAAAALRWSPEHTIGNNDRLARHVAHLVGAKAVLFLTDVSGVYKNDPSHNQAARMYAEVSSLAVMHGPHAFTTGLLGRGDMQTKLEEALYCFQIGMRAAIAGAENDVIVRFARGERVGTMIGNQTRLKEEQS